jgi:hypothetical protein
MFLCKFIFLGSLAVNGIALPSEVIGVESRYLTDSGPERMEKQSSSADAAFSYKHRKPTKKFRITDIRAEARNRYFVAYHTLYHISIVYCSLV